MSAVTTTVPLTAATITDAQIREYGYQASANGNDIDVMRAHLALAIPVSPSWARPWHARTEARATIAWDISRAHSPYVEILNARRDSEVDRG